MGKDVGPPESRQSGQETAAVIVMAVAQHHVINGGQVNAELLGIVDQSHTLAGIQKDASLVCFDPERQAVLGQHIAADGRVLDQDGYLCAAL